MDQKAKTFTKSNYMSDTFFELVWKPFLLNRPKPLTARSVQDYYTNISSLCSLMQKDFLDMTKDDVQRYFENIANKGLSKKTLQARLACYRSISNYICKHKSEIGMPESYFNVFEHVSIDDINVEFKTEDIPSAQTLNSILDISSDSPTYNMMFQIIMRCALSASEVCGLTSSDLMQDCTDTSFFILRKRDKVRYVKIPTDLYMNFEKYLNQLPYIPHPEVPKPLFLNQKGQAVSLRVLERYLKDCINKLNESNRDTQYKYYTLRDLRTAAIAYMLKGGATASAVSNYCGITERWFFRYNQIINDEILQPCDLSRLRVK